MQLGKLLIELAEESYLIIIHPSEYWKAKKNKQEEAKGVFLRFFLPGLILIFLAIVLGDFLFESEYGLLIKDTLIKALRKVLILGMSFFASTILLYEISRLHKIPVSFEAARKIIIYSMVPLVIITMVIGLFPFLDILGILGFYSYYLLYSALISIYEIKPKRNETYLVLLMGSSFIAHLFITFLFSKLTALIIY